MTLSTWSLIGTPTTVAHATAANFTINKPTGSQSGDVCIVVEYQERNPAQTVTPPTGWTQIRSGANTVPVDDANCLCFYKVLDGSEGSNFVFTHASVYRAACCATYRPPVLGALLHVDAAAVSVTSTTSLALTAITTTKANCLIIASETNFTEDNITAQTSPYVKDAEVVGGNGGGCAIVSNEQAAAGSTGTVTLTIQAATEGVGALHSFEPGVAAGLLPPFRREVVRLVK